MENAVGFVSLSISQLHWREVPNRTSSWRYWNISSHFHFYMIKNRKRWIRGVEDWWNNTQRFLLCLIWIMPQTKQSNCLWAIRSSFWNRNKLWSLRIKKKYVGFGTPSDLTLKDKEYITLIYKPPQVLHTLHTCAKQVRRHTHIAHKKKLKQRNVLVIYMNNLYFVSIQI